MEIKEYLSLAAVFISLVALLMNSRGVDFTETTKAGTAVYVALDGRFAGCIVINDTLKPHAAQAVKALKALGVTKTVMLTGDREAAAEKAAKEAGVDEFHAGLLPQGKVEIVDALCKAEGKRETMLATAKRMLKDGILALKDIARYSGLSLAQVKKLQASMA